MNGRHNTRVLITGAGGQLGCDLVVAFEEQPARRDVIAADHQALDVASREAVLQFVDAVSPDIIVHAGAWTAVDACEGDPDHALAVNALGTRHVQDACRRVRVDRLCVRRVFPRSL
jgi:dTDP-4-dehydrorhamnose reductase